MKRATIVADLGFGDSGKGTIVDFLTRARGAAAVIRFNGGGQAAHNVVTPDGRHHTFSLFGSGTFIPGVRTHLSRFVLVDPTILRNEARYLQSLGCSDPFSRLSVDEAALVVTPFQKAANRLRETLRGEGRHGSCGKGIGETMADSLNDAASVVRVRDIKNPGLLLAKFRALQSLKREEFEAAFGKLRAMAIAQDDLLLLTDAGAPEFFVERYREVGEKMSIVSGEYLRELSAFGEVIFEGAQGVLIDEWYGFHPYTTWSTTTFANALALLREIDYDGEVERLGVLRAYFTRHGEGPFPTEDKELGTALPDTHNGFGPWQRGFRVGWFDNVLARYALAVSGGADSLAVTNLDRFASVENRLVCTSYADRGSAIDRLEPKAEIADLKYQEGMTAKLGRVVPVYKPAPKNETQYLHMIETDLGVPLSIISRGPTANEKRFVADCYRETAFY